MSKLEELIKQLCPNGVKYKRLDEVFESFNGMTGVSNKWKENGNCQFIEYMNAYKNLKINIKLLPFATVKNLQQNTLQKGDILLTCASETPDECAVSSVIEDEIKDNVFLDDHLFGIRVKKDMKSEINTTFINYYMHTNNFRKKINKAVRGVTRFYISIDEFMKICIPVPPLEVQCEIVHILDDLTLLSAELSAELKARQQQYEYYKNELYSFKDKDVKYVKLKEIAEIYRGGNFQKKDFIENGKPCIHYGQIYTKYGKTANKTYTFVNDTVFEKSKQAGKNDIVMAVTSENIEDVCKCVVWLGNENIAVSGHTAIIHTKINARYLGYYFSTLHFFIDKAKLAHGTKVIEVTPSSLNDILIPVPSEEEQENIASKVEKFEKLCNDISEGLPAEIEARQKQYEYYRDKLLTFKELKVNE